MTMTNQKESLPQILSRRSVVKGLVGLTLASSIASCTSPGSSTVHSTPTHTASTPSPTSAATATPITSPTTTPLTINSPLLTYRGHRGAVYAVVWHRTRIVSGSEDHTAQVWDAASGKRLLTYSGNNNQVLQVGWSSD